MWPPFETDGPCFEPSPIATTPRHDWIFNRLYLLSIVCLPATMICLPLNLSLPERRDGVSCYSFDNPITEGLTI